MKFKYHAANARLWLYRSSDYVESQLVLSEFCAGETRFATAFIMLERLLQVKQGLEETVVAKAWKEWLEEQPRALVDEADDIKSTVSAP